MKEKSIKENRFQESRYFETRSYEEMNDEFRRNIQQIWRDPYYIDPKIVPEGMVYSWKRQFVDRFGFEDKSRIPDAMRKGWRAVPAERHPELASLDPTGRNVHVNGFIEKGGLILMERPENLEKLEKDVLQNGTYQQLHSHEAIRGNADFINVNNNSISYGPMNY